MATTFAPQPGSLIPSVLRFWPLLLLRSALASPETRRKVVSFVSIGALSTGAYLLLYLGLRTVTEATTANFLAQLISTIASTAANRKITFGVTDHSTIARHHAQMIGVFLFGLLVNSGALALLTVLDPTAGSVTELAVLTVSGLAATMARIMVMRRWSH